MTKKKDDTTNNDNLDELNVDDIDKLLDEDLDSDFDDDLFDQSENKKDSRKPAKFSVKSVAKNIKPNAAMIRTVGTKVGREFRNIGEASDKTIEVVSEFQRMKDDLVKDISPSINRLKRVSKKYLQRVERSLPKKLYNKLDKFLETEKSYRITSEEEQRNNQIQDQLTQIFSTQAEIQKEQFTSQKTDSIIKNRLDESRHEESITLLSQIRNLVHSNQMFFSGQFRNYLMKSLELKYRHVFVAQDTFNAIKTMSSIQEQSYKAIIKNTSLPDIQKQQYSESFKKFSREALYGKATKSLSDWYDNYASDVLKNFREKIFNVFKEGAKNAIDITSEMGEDYEEMRLMNEEMGVNEDSFLTKITSSLIKNLLVSTGLVSAKALVGARRFKDFDSAVRHVKETIPFKIRDFIDEKAENSVAVEWLRENIFPHLKTERGTLSNTIRESPTAQVPFDVLTRRSIVEIIPGFLAKILQKTSILSETTKITALNNIPPKNRSAFLKSINTEELVFDKTTEDFISVSEYKNKTMEDLFGTKEEKTNAISDVINTLYAGYSRKEGADIAAFEKNLPDIITVLNNIAKYTQVVKPKAILAYLDGGEVSDFEQKYLDLIFKNISEENKPKIAEILRTSFFKTNSEGEEVEDKDVVQDITRLTRELGIKNEEYLKKITELNVYGGKRFFKDILGNRTEEAIAEYENRIKAQYLRKYGSYELERNPKLRQEIYEKVRKFRRQKGIDQGAISNIQNDINFEYIRENLSSGSAPIRQQYETYENERADESASIGERLSKAYASSETARKIKRFKERFTTKEKAKEANIGVFGYKNKKEKAKEATKENLMKATKENITKTKKSFKENLMKGKKFISKIISSKTEIPEESLNTFGIGMTPIVEETISIKPKQSTFVNKEATKEKQSMPNDFKSYIETITKSFKTALYGGKKGKQTPIIDIKESVSNIEKLLADWTNTKMTMDAKTIEMLSKIFMGTIKDYEGLKGMKDSSDSGMFRKGVSSVGRGIANLGNMYIGFAKGFYKRLGSTFDASLEFIKDLSPGKLLNKGVSTGIDVLGKGFGAYYKLLGGLFGIGGGGVKETISTIFKVPGMIKKSMSKKAQDVYLKGEIDFGNPLIRAKDFINGKVFDEDGENVWSSDDIKGPLFDKDGNVLVSKDDIKKGLVTAGNEKVGTFRGIVTGALNLAKTGLKKYWGFTKKMWKTGFNVIKGAGRLIKNFGLHGISGVLKGEKNKIKNVNATLDTSSLKVLVTDKLQEIIDILIPIQKAVVGKNLREGGYKDYLRDEAADEEDKKNSWFNRIRNKLKGNKGNKEKVGKTEKEGGGGGILSFLGNKIKSFGGKIFGKGITKAAGRFGLTGLTGMLGLGGGEAAAAGGAALAGESALAGGAALAGEGALAAGGTGLLSTLGSGAAAAGTFLVSNPIGWAILGTAAVGALGYGAYKLWKGGKIDKQFAAIRNNGYGATPDKIGEIADLEDDTFDALKDRTSLTQSDINDYADDFGFDDDDQDQLDYFTRWYKERFLPVFKRGNEIMLNNFGKTFEDQRDLSEKQMDDYEKLVKNDELIKSFSDSELIPSLDGYKKFKGGKEKSKEKRKKSSVEKTLSKNQVNKTVTGNINEQISKTSEVIKTKAGESIKQSTLSKPPGIVNNPESESINIQKEQLSTLQIIVQLLSDIKNQGNNKMKSTNTNTEVNTNSTALINEIRNLIKAIGEGGLMKKQPSHSKDTFRNIQQPNKTTNLDVSKNRMVFQN